MPKKADLRVTKTLRAIRQAFLAALQNKPVNKVSVTELAASAEISKGTFYLHYTDIYDLYITLVKEAVDKVSASFDPYPSILEDPEKFVQEFMFADVPLLGGLSVEEAVLFRPDNVAFAPNFTRYFIDAFRERIYETQTLARNLENDIRLEFLLTGMFTVLIKYEASFGSENKLREFVVRNFAKSIGTLFE